MADKTGIETQIEKGTQPMRAIKVSILLALFTAAPTLLAQFTMGGMMGGMSGMSGLQGMGMGGMPGMM